MAYAFPYLYSFRKSPEKVLRSDVLKATAALDFPSIAAAASATLTIALPGAAVGDAASVSSAIAGGPTAGLLYTAWVSAAAVVTVRATNITVAAVDAVSGSFTVTAIKS